MKELVIQIYLKVRQLFCWHHWKSVEKFSKKVYECFKKDKQSYCYAVCEKCGKVKLLRLKHIHNPNLFTNKGMHN